MGLDLKHLIIREKTKLESFSSKVIAIDAYNAIYQFLSIIRGSDGYHLTDSKGNVTSHLSGLFYRNYKCIWYHPLGAFIVAIAMHSY